MTDYDKPSLTANEEAAMRDFFADAKASGEPVYTDKQLRELRRWELLMAYEDAIEAQRHPGAIEQGTSELDDILQVHGETEREQLTQVRMLLAQAGIAGIPTNKARVHFDYNILEVAGKELEAVGQD